MTLDELTITLSDKDGRLSVDTLTKALENALDMLRGVEATIVASDIEVSWEVVRATMRSPLRLTLSPRVSHKGRTSRPAGRKLVKSVLQGLAGIESGRNVPRYFTDDALDATRKLVKAASTQGTVVTFESKSVPKIKLTEQTVKHLDELSAKARLYVDFSTIEGRLEVISVHDHKSFFVWETLTNNKVECFVTDEQWKEASLLLDKRVAVTGRVHYRNHTPKTLHVDGPIRVLRESKDLPQPSDIGPIDITGGLSSEEHVRRMRNA